MTKATVLAKGTEMIISGFISKVDNNLVDFGWKKIKDANSERKSHEQNIETRIYQVTVDAINAFTFNKYKEQDTLYIVAESILKGFKNKKDKIEAVKVGLKMLESQITDDRCEDFLGTLCDEICKDENDILYKAFNIKQNEQTLREIRKGFEENTRNQGTALEILDDVREDTKYIRETLDNNKVNKAEYHSEIHVQNRAEKYAELWDKNVFLNDFNERDENAGINVKLKDIYLEKQLPHYIWKKNTKISTDLRKLLTEYVVEKNGNKMLLILGQPGIGKSTLITWMMANFKEKKEDFLVYQFASDLKNVNWQSDTIFEEILKTLNLICSEMEGKILILDGFDEINTNSDRERILNRINQELTGMNNLKNFSVVITCRENYVYKLNKLECYFITLQAWDYDQIVSFCEHYTEINKQNLSLSSLYKILENKEIFGIPLILYMVLALNINIEDTRSIIDAYDQIFSKDKNGIYDRCIENSRYGEEHRLSVTKEQIHQISQKIAFWIFENNAEKAFITQKQYEDICDTVINEISDGNENIKRDSLIGNYFKLTKYCEGVGTEELQFVHRSIYEYFVVLYFSEALQDLMDNEDAAGKLGNLLKDGQLSLQILEFIKCKFECTKRFNLSNVTREIFQIMLRDGMTYHIGVPLLHGLNREMNVFANMLEVVHLWNPVLGELNEQIISYLRYNTHINLNLEGIKLKKVDLNRVYLVGANLANAELKKANLTKADLAKVDLTGADLTGANLSGVDLSEANLTNAILTEVDFEGANLARAIFIGADLTGIDLTRVNLRKAIFDEKQVNSLYKKFDLKGTRVFLIKEEKIVNYAKYGFKIKNFGFS